MHDEETKVFLDLIHQKKITAIFNRNHQRNGAIHKDLNECSPKAVKSPGPFILVPAYFPLQSAVCLFHQHSRTLQPSLFAPERSVEALHIFSFWRSLSGFAEEPKEQTLDLDRERVFNEKQK